MSIVEICEYNYRGPNLSSTYTTPIKLNENKTVLTMNSPYSSVSTNQLTPALNKNLTRGVVQDKYCGHLTRQLRFKLS